MGTDTPDAKNRHFVCAVETFEDTTSVITEIDGVEIAVFSVDGEFYALANYCIHQGGPVCEGNVSGFLTAEQQNDSWAVVYEHDRRVVSCPWHGWEFDLETGEHLALSQYSLPTYDVAIDDDAVYVVK